MSDGESESPVAKKSKLDESQCPYLKEKSIDFSKDTAEGSSNTESKYTDFVRPEEIDKLKEFQVLDEVNDDDSDEENSDSSEGKSEVPDGEIEKMLEEDLPDNYKGPPKPKEVPYQTRQKVVLEEKGINQLEVLPLDWTMVRHCSGLPVYVHRATRVATLAKPYFLGKGNVRRHDIPISAIPCLSYRKALQEEAKQMEIDRRIAEQIKNGTWKNNLPNNTTTEATTNNAKNTVDTNGVAESNIVNGDDSEKISKREDNSKTENQCNVSSETKNYKVSNSEKKAEIDNGISNSNDKEANIDKKIEFDNKDIINKEEPENKNNIESLLNHGISNKEANIDKKKESEVDNKDSINKEEPVKKSSIDSVLNPNGYDEEEVARAAKPVILPGGIVMPPPRVESVSNSWKTQHLTPEQVNEYSRKLFKFKTINIIKFNHWADRRKYAKARKALQYPTLPAGTNLITIPASTGEGSGGHRLLGEGGGPKRDWMMNMHGRSYLSVFHEYVRRALAAQPEYTFSQLQSAAAPYRAVVSVGGLQYGVGTGSSKRLAKAAAARAAIAVLLPHVPLAGVADGAPEDDDPQQLAFFDCVGLEDPRVTELCAAACEPAPHAILKTCLLRNFGVGERHIQVEMKKLELQKIELTMKVGKHTATVVCKNKKTAKQRASQAILQALHPHIRSWGSLLRLYGSRSVKSCKEKKLEEQQITLLQDKARHNEPNYAVLEKLRHDMKILKERDAARVPIGTLLLKDDLPTHSGSNLNNVEL